MEGTKHTGTEDGQSENERTVSRRNFLARSAAATAGLLLFGTTSEPVQAQTTITQSFTILSGLSTPFFVPRNFTQDDREFDGNGPFVYVRARVSIHNMNELWVNVYMRARETESDWSTVSGDRWYKIWEGDIYGVREIVDINSGTYTAAQYINTKHGYNTIYQGPGEPVNRFSCRKDMSGDKAGTRTGVRVYFNPIQLTLRR